VPPLAPAVGRDPPARAAAPPPPPLPAIPPPRSLLPPPPLPQPRLHLQPQALAAFYQPGRGPPHWAAPRSALGAATVGWPVAAPAALARGAFPPPLGFPAGALAGALAPLALAPPPGPLLRAEARAAAPPPRLPPSPLLFEAVFPAPLVPLALAPEDLLGFLPPPRLGGAGGSATESGDDDDDDCADDGLARAFAAARAQADAALAALPRAAGARAPARGAAPAPPASNASSDSGSAGGGGGRARGRAAAREDLSEARLRRDGYFDMPIKAAAARLGKGVTTLKKACRSFGLRRWPFRHRASMRAAREKTERWAPDAAAALAEFGAAAEADAPSADARRMRQAVFKAENRAAHAGPGQGRAGVEEALRKTLRGLAP
jgi:hypothetical protein